MVYTYTPKKIPSNQNVSMTVRIISRDCGSKRLTELTVRGDSPNVGHWYEDPKTKELVQLTENDKTEYMGEKLKFRTIMNCESLDGFCCKCSGLHMGVTNHQAPPNKWAEKSEQSYKERIRGLTRSGVHFIQK